MTTTRTLLIASATVALLSPSPALAQEGLGLAGAYPGDRGLSGDPAVLLFLDFEDEATTTDLFNRTGYGWTSDSAHVRHGAGALEVTHSPGTHDPGEIQITIPDSVVVYVRWYRMWEPGYDFTAHKMPGVYARRGPHSPAGVPPTGFDKFSCKASVDWERRPNLYSYHPDQGGPWGEEFEANLPASPPRMEAGRWYAFEIMLRANTVGARDGELKMWIDGVLVTHHERLRFRDTSELQINEFTHSAYVGGSWTSARSQHLWDDQIVVATEYIGPIATAAPDAGVPSPDAGVASDAGRTDELDAGSAPGLDAGVGPLDASHGDDAGGGGDGGEPPTCEHGCNGTGRGAPAGTWPGLLLGAALLVLRRRRPMR